MTRKPKTTEPTSAEIRASIREFSKLMSPAPEPTKAPAINPAVFSIDAESSRLFELVRNA